MPKSSMERRNPFMRRRVISSSEVVGSSMALVSVSSRMTRDVETAALAQYAASLSAKSILRRFLADILIEIRTSPPH